ncbi:hypothetical protein ND810_11830, partial [Leptospira levettii]|nr:hypothetical protein [Leptospira levettii]
LSRGERFLVGFVYVVLVNLGRKGEYGYGELCLCFIVGLGDRSPSSRSKFSQNNHYIRIN